MGNRELFAILSNVCKPKGERLSEGFKPQNTGKRLRRSLSMSEPPGEAPKGPESSVSEAGVGGELGRTLVGRAEQHWPHSSQSLFVLPPASPASPPQLLLTTVLTPNMEASGFQLPVRDEAGPEAEQVNSLGCGRGPSSILPSPCFQASGTMQPWMRGGICHAHIWTRAETSSPTGLSCSPPARNTVKGSTSTSW